jgi:hypothetical protein
MTSSNYSGHVSRTLIDGRTHVFLKGNLTCPFGTGSIRADGLSVIVQGWELSIHQRNRREVIKIDEKILADLATRVFMDSQDRIFLGTKKGLFILNKDGSWKLPEKSELREDHISDIKEDGKGNIWVATRIKSSSDEAEPPREYQPLHTLTSNGWAHFGTDQGLDSFGISEIEIHEGNIFLGTSQGFAKISPRAEVMIQGPREVLPVLLLNQSPRTIKEESGWGMDTFFPDSPG